MWFIPFLHHHVPSSWLCPGRVSARAGAGGARSYPNFSHLGVSCPRHSMLFSSAWYMFSLWFDGVMTVHLDPERTCSRTWGQHVSFPTDLFQRRAWELAVCRGEMWLSSVRRPDGSAVQAHVSDRPQGVIIAQRARRSWCFDTCHFFTFPMRLHRMFHASPDTVFLWASWTFRFPLAIQILCGSKHWGIPRYSIRRVSNTTYQLFLCATWSAFTLDERSASWSRGEDLQQQLQEIRQEAFDDDILSWQTVDSQNKGREINATVANLIKLFVCGFQHLRPVAKDFFLLR